jgi:hypothetical protein
MRNDKSGEEAIEGISYRADAIWCFHGDFGLGFFQRGWCLGCGA